MTVLRYATVEQGLALFDQRPTTPTKLEHFLDLLEVSAEEIDREIGRDFRRHPASGTETRVIDVSGGAELCLHGGVISLTTVELRNSIFDSYETADATDWELYTRGAQHDSGRPYDHLRLLGAVRWSTFPTGAGLMRLTGAFGWAAPPKVVIEENRQRTRQLIFADPSHAGAQIGPEEFGRPTGPEHQPDVWWRFKQAELHRFWCSM